MTDETDVFRSSLEEAAAKLGISLSEDQLERFDKYYRLLMDWNERVNLTAITAPEEVAVKHMADSLAGYDALVFPPACRVIDVGTGAGFPGIPLKIMRPDLKLDLLDSLNKRLVFLGVVQQELMLEGINTYHSRAEEAARQKPHREQYDVATSRAVARLNILCELCLPFLKVGGTFIAYKSAKFEEELQEAERAIQILGGAIRLVKKIELPGSADFRAIIYITKTGHTPSVYPRRPGLPEKKPL